MSTDSFQTSIPEGARDLTPAERGSLIHQLTTARVAETREELACIDSVALSFHIELAACGALTAQEFQAVRDIYNRVQSHRCEWLSEQANKV